MNEKILSFSNKIEGWKTAIKNLHWASSSLPQHELCDSIADDLSNFQDVISEIEQGIHGKIKLNQVKGESYNITSLKTFAEDVIKDTTDFYKTLAGDDYIGMKSEVETFIGKMQKNLYLINFTIKEDRERRNAVIREMKEKYVIIESNNGKRIKLTESAFRDLVKESVNNAIILSEGTRKLGKHSMNKIKNASENLAKQIYGDKYGQKVDKFDHYFPKHDREVHYDADIATGLFALGNQKLSSDTLIINFTSALGCPSVNSCPITQQACYAVAGENRLSDTRRKNLIVQNLWRSAERNDMLQGVFDIAELYVTEANKTKKPIKYIRFNEVGDFDNNKVLIKTAEFAKKMRDKYGILSMAYTAKKNIDPTIVVDGEPIDEIITINRSRNDIPKSENALDRKFYGIPMSNFSSDPDINLENSYCDVVEVTDEQANQLKCTQPVKGKYGIPSVPILTKGSWDGGSGLYYVCPCSFWRYNKDKAAQKYLMDAGVISKPEEFPEDDNARRVFLRKLSPEIKKGIKDATKNIHSPCGVQCAVCHDMEGGIYNGQSGIKDYCVLTATHGATKDNYDANYAEKKRNGDDTVVYKDPTNPNGRWTKFDAPINKNLLTYSHP